MYKNQNKYLLFITLLFTISIFIACQKSEHKITKRMIENSEKLIGLSFNDAKRDSMQDNLNDQLKDYQKVREFELDNGIPPSILFNPIPAGKQFESKSSQFKADDYSGTKLPLESDELAFYSIGQLAELIRTGKTTSLQLTKLYLERLRKQGPTLECVITLTEKLALTQAKRTDKEIEVQEDKKKNSKSMRRRRT